MIPALNEATVIRAAIRSVIEDAAEVVVADGGSEDATVREAKAMGAIVVLGPRGRGAQMDKGAAFATGDWLLFLHADTRLDPGWAGALRSAGRDVVGGAFRFALDSPRLRYRLLEAGVRLRVAAFSLPFGDQALFVRRSAFLALGGFRGLAIAEDLDLVRRLRQHGQLAFLPVAVRTSARRWEERGFLRTTALNWTVLLLHSAGVPGHRLARLYGARAGVSLDRAGLRQNERRPAP